jgi:hypothetical protein
MVGDSFGLHVVGEVIIVRYVQLLLYSDIVVSANDLQRNMSVINLNTLSRGQHSDGGKQRAFRITACLCRTLKHRMCTKKV